MPPDSDRSATPSSTGRDGPGHADGRGGRIGRVARAALATAVGVAALLVLAFGAHAVAGRTDRADGAAAARADALDAAYYHCLSLQAHSLVRSGQDVSLRADDLPSLVTLAKAVGSWTVITPDADRTDVELLLESRPHRGCLGSVVVARIPGRDGRPAVERVGHGATVPGPPPPAV